MSTGASKRIEQVQQPLIPLVGSWIAEHPGTISLAQGVVHYGPPKSVYSVVDRPPVDDVDLNRYGSAVGIAALREQIWTKLKNENSIARSGREVVVTAGSNMAFLNAVLSIADISDEFLLPSPYYFNHHMAIEIAGCCPVAVGTLPSYQLDLPALKRAITSRTRAIVTVSPNNPSGAVYPRGDLEAVNALCREAGIYHIHDEAYEYFVYGEQSHFSPGSLSTALPHTISLFTLSKAFAMAGWRIGYMVIPQTLTEAVKKVQDTNLVCPPMISQLAALAALRAGHPWCNEQISDFPTVRDIVSTELQRLGSRFRVVVPDGAFYVLVDCGCSLPDSELVRTLIADFGVATLPGSTFGITDRCVLRVSFGGLPVAQAPEALQRLIKGLNSLI